MKSKYSSIEFDDNTYLVSKGFLEFDRNDLNGDQIHYYRCQELNINIYKETRPYKLTDKRNKVEIKISICRENFDAYDAYVQIKDVPYSRINLSKIIKIAEILQSLKLFDKRRSK